MNYKPRYYKTMLGITTQFKARTFALAFNLVCFSYGLERHFYGMVLNQVWIRFGFNRVGHNMDMKEMKCIGMYNSNQGNQSRISVHKWFGPKHT